MDERTSEILVQILFDPVWYFGPILDQECRSVGKWPGTWSGTLVRTYLVRSVIRKFGSQFVRGWSAARMFCKLYFS